MNTIAKRILSATALVAAAFAFVPSSAQAWCNEHQCGTTDVLVDQYCDDSVCQNPHWVNTYDRYVRGCQFNERTGMCMMTYPGSWIFVCGEGECYQYTFIEEDQSGDFCAPPCN
jgi:hypothetical protein